MIGRTISHFEILAKLGEGGMGVVYQAMDTRLKRLVSLKFVSERLGPADREALRREAQHAASLNHPNIGTVYELEESEGESFLVMEYIPGATLADMVRQSDRIPLHTAFDLALQITGGLCAAHEEGILHGDMKSSNIMVTPEGRAKILDFGVARILGSPHPPGPEWTPGTTAYMSPEQVRGEPQDQRSDLWSLGIVLFELFTGRLPFTGRYEQAINYAILHEKHQPPSKYRPDLPRELDAVVGRALAKKPAARYATAKELLEDLRRAGSTTAPVQGSRWRRSPRALRRIVPAIVVGLAVIAGVILLARQAFRPGEREPDRQPSVAVLPFRTLGPDTGEDYAGDGITEAVITDLTAYPDLIVIARRSVMPYRDQTRSTSDIARDLRVRYVVDGSMQRSGSRVRVNVQIVDAAADRQVWADRFDRDTTDLLGLQDDISARVAAALPVALLPRAIHASGPMTTDPAAYSAYLRGIFYGSRVDRTFTGVPGSTDDAVIGLLRQAVSLDPRFAIARAALAGQYITKVFNRDPSPRWLEFASQQIDTAFSIDPYLPEAHLARGYLLWTRAYGFQHAEALRSVRRALTERPGSADAHDLLGTIEVHVGLLDEALREFRTTLRLDPRNVSARNRIPGVFLYSRQYARVLEEFAQHPEFSADMQWMRALAMLHLGMTEHARKVLDSCMQALPDNEDLLAASAVVCASQGDRAGAEQRIARAIALGRDKSHFHHAEYNIACAYALLGDRPNALHWLQETALNGMPCYPLFDGDDFLRSLETESVYATIVRDAKGMRDECARLP